MLKKLSFFIGLVLLSINLGNGKIFSFFSYIKQRIYINNISPEKMNICDSLQSKIENYVYNFNSNISVSVINGNGEFIVDINGKTPRIPASNQKILSSAFSLDTLGPNYTLKTSLKKINNGIYYIEASGDPDFDEKQLNTLISVLNNTNQNNDHKLPIIIKSSNIKKWWPSSWSYADRKEEYGAPITKYSLSSNASIKALNNPIDNFIDELNIALKKQNLFNKYFIKKVNTNYNVDDINTLKIINSAPLYILLNLINSESHNFTAEVVFRHSLNNWSHDFPNVKYSKWLREQNFSSETFIFADASGLSRQNRVTTYGLSQFLRRMKFNRFSDYYFSSFSILGVRGSLANVKLPLNLNSTILAKSGTLTNVRSISGLMLGKDNYFSIIINNMDNSLKHILYILSLVDNSNYCN
tara:strand:- start:486 stop:1721 length:1236 start_codon:yes stop_codon:yes gene_type:complete